MASLIYRIFSTYSLDTGITFGMQTQVYPIDPNALNDNTWPTTRQQTYFESHHDRHFDILYTDSTGRVGFATMSMPPFPEIPAKINKLNRKRTVGNEL
jgi:hypothetical protein